jgi:hypothetical protein
VINAVDHPLMTPMGLIRATCFDNPTPSTTSTSANPVIMKRIVANSGAGKGESA